MTDWDEIQKEFEEGSLSLRALATKYDVPLTTLYRRSQKWQAPERNTERQKQRNADHFQLQLVKMEAPSPANAVEGASLGIDALVAYLRKNYKEMDLADHVKASNALAQYNKIIINAPPDEEEDENEDFSGFTNEELLLYAELQERAKKHA